MAAQLQPLTPQLLKALFEVNYTALVRTAFRFLNNIPAAEDLVQEIFCTLWEKRNNQQIESYEAYLRRAVYNRCISTIKKQRATHFTDLEEEALPAATSYTTTDQTILAKETKTKIDAAINSLPTACRTIFILSRFENLSNKEIAQELQLSPKTVENQMTKALRILKSALLYFFIFLKIF
ncbi:MAG: RNA polymerase sigma-70 factor [Chitinophagaceae bacterium]